MESQSLVVTKTLSADCFSRYFQTFRSIFGHCESRLSMPITKVQEIILRATELDLTARTYCANISLS